MARSTTALERRATALVLLACNLRRSDARCGDSCRIAETTRHFSETAGWCANVRTRVSVDTPPRTGSTVLYNILRAVLPNATVTKGHSTISKGHTMQLTPLRHPLDSLVSLMVRDRISLLAAYNEYATWGGRNLAELQLRYNLSATRLEAPGVALIPYDELAPRPGSASDERLFERLFLRLERLFHCTVPSHTREHVRPARHAHEGRAVPHRW